MAAGCLLEQGVLGGDCPLLSPHTFQVHLSAQTVLHFATTQVAAMSSESAEPSLAQSARDIVLAPILYPKLCLKWCLPPFTCFLCFCCQSVLLHLTTVKFVNLHEQKEPLAQDAGHLALGKADVPMQLLDMISGGVLMCFVAGAVLLRDLRTWSKLFFCNGILFVLKGVFDYVTVLPDSIGMDKCQARLGVAPLKEFERLGKLSGQEFIDAMISLELRGVGGTWPVRYCADMLLSGHTFVMLLYLLAVADLGQRATLLMESPQREICQALIGIFALCCTAADLYLIVINHFHYTVDVVMAIVMTFLLYTNAGMAVVVQWYASEHGEGSRNTEDNGMVWVPTAMFPFCCFGGYYKVKKLQSKEVLQRQAADGSAAWERLAGPGPEAKDYGTMQAPQEKTEAWNDEPKMVNRWNTLIRLVAKRRRMQDVFQVYDAMRALWVRADHGTTEFIARAAVATVDLSGLVDSFHTMPPARYPEVVFVGWSNVGKSSLINSLLHRTAVAPVSTMPGKTTQFHFYTINEHNAAFPKMTLVDVPGIGEAMADEVQTRHWRRTLDLYLKERGPTLRQVFHLISCEVLLRRQRPSPLDISVMEMCLHHRSKFNLDYTLVITKIDLIRSKKDAETVYENLCKVVRRLRLGSAKIVPASVRSTTGRVLLWKRLWRSVDPENSTHSSQDLSALRQEVERLVEAKDAEALIARAKEESGDGWECIVRGILALGRLHDAWQIIQAGPQRAQGLEEHETAEDAEEDMEMLKEGLLEAAEAGEEAEKDQDDEDAPEVSEDEAGDFFAIPEDLESEQMAAMQERAALAVGEAALAPKSEGGEPLLAPRDPALAEEVAMLLSKEHRGAAAELLMEQVVAIARLESLDSGPGQFPRSFGKLEALLKQAKEDAIFTPWSADRWNRLLRVVGSQANLNAVERVLDYMSQFQVTGDQETDAVMAELVVSSVDLGGQAPGPSELDPEPGSAPKVLFLGGRSFSSRKGGCHGGLQIH
ncbi:engB [Symbiodinium necroappetens]|uniref:EngB protein n=1 Tax=Symbiodinium necroappetens TaxID=1628268 RepID=A0A812UFH5_9DINO|nr:engB [Symbiodinium necroappetens]